MFDSIIRSGEQTPETAGTVRVEDFSEKFFVSEVAETISAESDGICLLLRLNFLFEKTFSVISILVRDFLKFEQFDVDWPYIAALFNGGKQSDKLQETAGNRK